ncbi:phage terminase large subunit family protein [Botrimarina hoheduenensis]|uniref:Terminase-like family protein n=1 Tax=Botrimarina hoheduenensis TaxID=2528000 RepID=A0A5C5W8Z2_9BACT|nr:hypothetical protein [Botrimarina hoheduenensis]TWT46499.1 Terminase-like family protein [Botrimarina hoheduenensis]
MNETYGDPLVRFTRRLRRAVESAFVGEPVSNQRAEEAEGLLSWSRRMLPRHFAKPPSAMHRWLANRLDEIPASGGAKINLLGPRGGAKSTIGTLAHVLRAALEGAEPYIWIVSDTKDQAQSHLENVKTELLENEQLAAAYPRRVGRGSRWTVGGIELRGGTVIEAYGTGQRIRGRRRRAHRPTLIICDDLENEVQAASPHQRSSSYAWFHGTLLKAGTRRTSIVNLATALHRDALAMRLHRTAGWRSRLFRSVVSWPTNVALWDRWEALYCDLDRPHAGTEAKRFYDANRLAMHAGAEVLWPEEEDLYTLMRMRVESGRPAFEREKQNSPVDPERCEWPEAYFGEEVWFDDWPTDLRLRTIALDPSKGRDARQGDYSAIVMLGVDSQGRLLVDADLARRPTPQMVADAVAHCQRFRPDAFGVESNQWQQLLAGEFIAEFHRQGLLGVVPSEMHNYTSKPMRIRRLGPYLSQRRIRFRRGSPGAELLLDQLRDFPLGDHDDGPDALEMALRLAEDLWRRETSAN